MHVMRSGKFKMVCRNCVCAYSDYSYYSKGWTGGGHANVGYSFMLITIIKSTGQSNSSFLIRTTNQIFS